MVFCGLAEIFNHPRRFPVNPWPRLILGLKIVDRIENQNQNRKLNLKTKFKFDLGVVTPPPKYSTVMPGQPRPGTV
jgi:hypothetical protein